MRYLTLAEILVLHRCIIEQSGGADGVRNLGGIESAVAQPQMAFGGEERRAVRTVRQLSSSRGLGSPAREPNRCRRLG